MKKIGFLVHPRTTADVIRKFPILKFLPRKVFDLVVSIFPIITVSKITGLKNAQNENVEGYVLGILISPEQMTKDRTLALKKIISAAKKAKKMGIGIMGLGAMTASFSKGGLDIIDAVKGIGITTGRAYTTKTVTDYVKHVIHNFGSSCLKILHAWGIKEFVLIDMERKLDTVHEYADGIEQVKISHDIIDIKPCDIVITATSAPETLVTSELVHPGMVIINDAQPSDVSPKVVKERDDVLVIEGGVVHTKGVHSNFHMGPRGKDENYCCLAEVLVLAHHGHFENYATGNLDLSLIDHIEEYSKPLNFTIAKYQNFIQGYIPDEQVEKVKKILHEKVQNRKVI
jgi:fatty aldehyde-generating acyl-ACP reductase